MSEKSQIDEMRAAIRGDIERARARREADPWRTPEPEQRAEPAPEPEPEVVPEPEPEPWAEVVPGPGPEPEPAESAPLEDAVVDEPVAVEEPEQEPKTKPGLFARLFGRG
jgi:hypothetical protein